MRVQMHILYSNKSNNDSGRIGKEAAMSYLSTYQMNKTTINPSQANQQETKSALGNSHT
jgi:hypothetical protein